MAIEKEIKIKVDKSEAEQDLNKLDNKIKSTDKSADSLNKNLDKGFSNTEKGVEKTTKSVSGLSSGFKKLGTAIKAAGIGLLVSVVAGLTTVLSNNQKVTDAVGAVFKTVSIVLNEVVNAFTRVYESVSSNTENFDALGKVLKGVLTIAITPLKLGFFAIKLGIQQAQLVWEKSFFGGKDNERIKELTIGILETKEAIYNTGKDAVEAGKDIYNNFSEAIEETTTIATKSVEELSKISIKASYEQAKALQQLQNNAKIAQAEQQRLVEVYDRQAEKLRQLRDDDSRSVNQRLQDNEKLKSVLDQQEEALLKQANAQIALAQAELNRNNNIENRVALIEALSNKEGVLAQIEGFRSEQITNRISLLKEQQELENISKDAEIERQIAQKEFEAEQEQNELRKFEIQKERLNLENELLLQDLERKREIYKEGTLAREQAEQEYLTSKQRIEREITKTERLEGEKRKELNIAVENAKLSIAGNTLDLIGGLLKEGSDLAKGVAVAQATISGIEGVQNAFTSGAKNPITTIFPAFPFIQAGLAGAFSALQIGKILSTDSSGASVSAGQSQSPSLAPPSFNLVAGTPENQISESIQQQNQRPIQAFVVSRSVTSAQEMDRNIESAATI